MAHNCPNCGSACYCNGDIDDIFGCNLGAEDDCCHCDDDDDADYDDQWEDGNDGPEPEPFPSLPMMLGDEPKEPK